MAASSERRRFRAGRQRSLLVAIAWIGLHSILFAPPAWAVGARDDIPYLDLSHQLTTLGIASHNLTPNDPTLDARPLIAAGLQYAKDNALRAVVADKGDYYLLTPGSSTTYIDIYQFADMSIDFAGSTIYMKEPYRFGFSITDSHDVRLSNFTLDYLRLPYTHVQLTSVDANGRRLLYGGLPAWEDPQTLAANAVSPFGEAFEFWAVAFRNGDVVPGTNHMLLAMPAGGGVLNIVNNGMPWAQPETLATLQPGDTIVVIARGGAAPIQAFRSDAIEFYHLNIYASPTWAVTMVALSNSTMDQVNVLPRPGVGLVGSNADGLHFTQSGPNNHIINSYVTRTLDDGIAMDSQAIATIITQTGPRLLHVKRFAWSPFPNGTPITLVDPYTTLETDSAVIVSQTPATLEYNGELDIQLDRDVHVVHPNTFLVFGSDLLRGQGSSIEDNVVEDIVSGRGIWVNGNHGVAIRRNRIGHTSSGGIVISQDTLSYPGPPSKDILIESNILQGSVGPMAQNTGSQTALGAIIVTSTDDHAFNFAQTPGNHGITIRSNYIADAGRAGIWLGEVDGGVLQNNVIVRWYRHPEMLFWGLNPADRTIALEDVTKAIAVRYSANITQTNNTSELISSSRGAVRLSPAGRPSSKNAATGTIAVHSTVTGLQWTAKSTASWLTVTAGDSGTGDGPVTFSLDANNSGSLRRGAIVIAGVEFVVTQSADGTVPPLVGISRNVLRFAAATTVTGFSSQTGPQTVGLTESGGAAVPWTATSSQPWLTVTPSSGTGPATLTVSVTATPGLPAQGAVSGSIDVAFTGAFNTLDPIDVSLTLLPAASAAAPFGSVDTPVENATGVTGAVPFTGWALDDIAVSRVMICRAAFGGEVAPVDPNCGGAAQVFVGFPVFIEGARPDVATGFAGYPMNTRAGWGFMVLTNMLPNQGNGTYTFFTYTQDRDGHTVLLGTRTITCDNAHATKPFGAIDTPEQGGTTSGGSYVNFGWVLTQAGKSIPVDGSTITAIVDGVARGTVDYNHNRADIETLFPGLANSHGAIGFRILDTTTMPNGLHTISWTVTDSGGAIEGIGSRFFNVSNGTSGVTAAVAAAAASSSSVDALPLENGAVIGRHGWDLNGRWALYPVGRAGRAIVRGEEVDRFELWLGAGSDDEYRGYLRVGGGLEPLPAGSSLDRETGTFTWSPGVGFVGTYDLVFVRLASASTPAERREVRIILAPKGRGYVGTQLTIDAPRPEQVVDQPFAVTGWAADLDAVAGSGIDTIHAWAYPVHGGAPIFIGTPTLGAARPDVAAVHGDRFGTSGFELSVLGLASGTYDLALFPWSNVAGSFAPPSAVRVTVR